jgi:hypothetical protein
MSHVAGVIDTYGGLRVVVGTKRSIRANARCDDLMLIVPELRIREPVQWEKIPWLVGRVQHHVREWIMARNDPNHPRRENITMYQLRLLEHAHCKRALSLSEIAYT